MVGFATSLPWDRSERTVQFAALLSLVFYASAHARAFTAAELEAMLDEAGFTGVRAMRPTRLPGGAILVGSR